MKTMLYAAAAAATLALAAPAFAEPYDDYTPQKGAWEVQEIHVDPNHIDDYLTGLKHSWYPQQELAKRKGIIDQYMVMVKLNASGRDANVMLAQHYPSMAVLDPDRARDKAIEQEGYAIASKEKQEAAVSGYDKYRTFMSDNIWTVMDMSTPK